MRRTRVFGAMLFAAATVATSGATSASAAARHLPQHIFAPYFEGYNGDSPAALAAASGNKYLTLAFIQTPAPGSCDISWNGDATTPIAWSTYGADIAAIRARGGDVVPSFGGYGADSTGTEIADSCTDVGKIAADYEKVITTYGVTRLDFDVEDLSESNSAGVDRRNKAIKLVEDWAARHHRQVQFVYTLGTNMDGMNPTGVAILQNAVADHARVDIVNIMTFDYYDDAPHEMAQDTVTAAAAVVAQLRGVYPHESDAELYRHLGVTEMLGIDDYGPPEVFTPADARAVEKWADSKHLAELSFWALQRDNGGCVGTAGSDSCSGVDQRTWQFSKTFEQFTSR